MSLSINIQSNIDQVIKDVGRFYARQVPFAAAVAMTRTAKIVEKANRGEMKRVFKNPTRYTLNAQYVKPATKRDLSASVWLKGSNRKRDRHYLEPHVTGGSREPTGFERALQRIGLLAPGWFAIPGKYMSRGSRGNITRGTYQKVLAQLRGFQDSQQNVTGSARSKRNRRSNAFFVNRNTRPPGIWMRKGKRVFMAFIFVKGVRYQKRFRFFEVAAKTTARHWPREFNKALRHAIRTAR